jgi:hypothetical protein
VRHVRRIIFPVLSNVIWNYNKSILLLALICISNPVLVFLSEPAETQTGTANSAEAHRDAWNDGSSAEEAAGLITRRPEMDLGYFAGKARKNESAAYGPDSRGLCPLASKLFHR